MKQYWTVYEIPRDERDKDKEWRNSVLGIGHWFGETWGADHIEITAVFKEEEALWLKLTRKARTGMIGEGE